MIYDRYGCSVQGLSQEQIETCQIDYFGYHQGGPISFTSLWEFGESSLDFWAWFWADVTSPLDIWRIQSSIRYRILELFNEQGITIAFPQRDVHLDSSSPLHLQGAQAETNDRETQGSRQHAMAPADPVNDLHAEKEKDAEQSSAIRKKNAMVKGRSVLCLRDYSTDGRQSVCVQLRVIPVSHQEMAVIPAT